MKSQSPNLLADEKSPYLLQHSFNPVQWYPWGAAAFEAAKAQDKPIFLSIGYSTCYWCHVMEKDSFEQSDVAEILNHDFISIKVDREERPDVDAIYMDVVVGLTGHGGWPMSVFLTSDGKPFWGGTFFWRNHFKQVLAGIAKAWQSDRQTVLGSAASITEIVAEQHDTGSGNPASFLTSERAANSIAEGFDPEWGGFGPAPKFPPSQQCRLLLREYRRTGDPAQLQMVTQTVDCMLRGGLYDQIGGGFSRYSTDAQWLVPHFEKMLYDNALLVMLLIELYQVTSAEHYKRAACETLDFISREMASTDGVFMSAIDAGEVDREGEYYVWTFDELKQALTAEEFDLLNQTYIVSEAGNFEGKNILTIKPGISWVDYHAPQVSALRSKLLRLRSHRQHPLTDDKILTSWNGLAIEAFAKAAQIFGSDQYRTVAVNAAERIHAQLWSNNYLAHRYRDGHVMQQGFLEDYAYLVQGLITLYETCFDESWLLWALQLQLIQTQLFWDAEAGGYFATADDSLICKKRDLLDGALPSPQSVSYLNLLRLNCFFPEQRFDQLAEDLRCNVWGAVERHPAGFCSLLIGVNFLLASPPEIAIVLPFGTEGANSDLVQAAQRCGLGERALAVYQEGDETSLPILRDRGIVDGKSAVYVCRNHRCALPVTSVQEFNQLMCEV